MVKVRPAHIREAKLIADFQKKMAFETEQIELNDDVLFKGVQAVFEVPERGEYFVATIDDEIIAGSLLITYEWSDWRNCYIAWIQSVYVQPEYRKKGIFKALYMHVKDMVQNQDRFGGVRLYVEYKNELAAKVYTSLGMDGDHYRVFEWLKKGN